MGIKNSYPDPKVGVQPNRITIYKIVYVSIIFFFKYCLIIFGLGSRSSNVIYSVTNT